MKRFPVAPSVRRVAVVACSLLAIGAIEITQTHTADAGGCGRSGFGRSFGGGMLSMARMQYGNFQSAPSYHRAAPSHGYTPAHNAGAFHSSTNNPVHFQGHSSVVMTAPPQHSGYPVHQTVTYDRPIHETVIQPSRISESGNHSVGSSIAMNPTSQVQSVARPIISPVQTPARQASQAVPSQVSKTPKQSALQMLETMGSGTSQSSSQDELGSTGIPTFTTTPQSGAVSPAHVGVWQAKLPSSASVVLELRSDNTFRWVATSDGKTSSFDGNYTLEGKRLVLQRSNDNGQLDGTWTANGANVNRFKVGGASDNGLEFVKVPDAGI